MHQAVQAPPATLQNAGDGLRREVVRVVRKVKAIPVRSEDAELGRRCVGDGNRQESSLFTPSVELSQSQDGFMEVFQDHPSDDEVVRCVRRRRLLQRPREDLVAELARGSGGFGRILDALDLLALCRHLMKKGSRGATYLQHAAGCERRQRIRPILK